MASHVLERERGAPGNFNSIQFKTPEGKPTGHKHKRQRTGACAERDRVHTWDGHRGGRGFCEGKLYGAFLGALKYRGGAAAAASRALPSLLTGVWHARLRLGSCRSHIRHFAFLSASLGVSLPRIGRGFRVALSR